MRGDALCPICHEELNKSKYVLRASALYKSCPSCSQRNGTHVYYMCPERFGLRTFEGKKMTQSQCYICRGSSSRLSFEGEFTCGDENLHEIRSVRILPTNRNGFKPAEGFEEFIDEVLPERGYRYYFRRGMDNPDGTFILFQNEGRIKGHALVRSSVRIPNGIEVEGEQYSGYLELYPESIEIYHEPITLERLHDIDSKIISLNQSMQKMEIASLSLLRDAISNDGCTQASERINSYVHNSDHYEGMLKRSMVNRYERNSKAREECLEHYMESGA